MDTDLVVRAQRGDKGAYALLATGIADRFLAVARRILRDIDLAEDATQQALLAVWQDLPQLRDPLASRRGRIGSSCTPAMSRVGRNVTGHRISGCCPTMPPRTPTLSTVVDRDQLDRGFRRLSIDHRAVVVLHHYLDLPLDRVAEILGIPAGTAHSRLHHAMRALRAALEADLRPTAREVI